MSKKRTLDVKPELRPRPKRAKRNPPETLEIQADPNEEDAGDEEVRDYFGAAEAYTSTNYSQAHFLRLPETKEKYNLTSKQKTQFGVAVEAIGANWQLAAHLFFTKFSGMNSSNFRGHLYRNYPQFSNKAQITGQRGRKIFGVAKKFYQERKRRAAAAEARNREGETPLPSATGGGVANEEGEIQEQPGMLPGQDSPLPATQRHENGFVTPDHHQTTTEPFLARLPTVDLPVHQLSPQPTVQPIVHQPVVAVQEAPPPAFDQPMSPSSSSWDIGSILWLLVIVLTCCYFWDQNQFHSLHDGMRLFLGVDPITMSGYWVWGKSIARVYFFVYWFSNGKLGVWKMPALARGIRKVFDDLETC